MDSENSPSRPIAAFLLAEQPFDLIYSTETRREIAERTELRPGRIDADGWRDQVETLAEVEVLFSGWGMAHMDEAFLAACPNLRHVFYGAGSVRHFYTPAAIERGVGISSAWRANAVPVAEFAHATIILALKRFWHAARSYPHGIEWGRQQTPGAFHSTVGLLSLGAIGRMVAERLRRHEIRILAHDPFVDRSSAEALGVQMTDLPTLFRESDVVSIHAPNLPSTRGMVTGDLLRSMREGAALVNTARGAVINEPELLEVLRERQDIQAVLDVTTDEPEGADSPFWQLPNAVLTPHIAGSMGRECARMGVYMLEELERYLAGEPLRHAVTPPMLETMA